MAIASKTLVLSLVVLLLFLVGGILLQIFLSRRESRWPGLVLPLLAFLQSLLLVLNVADTGSASQNVLTVLVTLLVGNIPTLVLLAVYWAAREKIRVKSQMERMEKQDVTEL
ncbi:MAG: hypothetical protein HFG09_08120 [Oscillibacter sp.]|nr:hypothetical protein [Oscillibacter sp.]